MLRVPVGVIWLTSRVLDILKVCARARNADKMSVAMFHAQSYPFTSAGMTQTVPSRPVIPMYPQLQSLK